MPYKAKGKCIYKKDTGKKVGCTKGSVEKYLAALHANVVDEQENLKEARKIVRENIELILEAKKKKNKKLDAGDEIHLPELTMKKKDLINYLKDLYNFEVKEK
jgi:hypothetical protein